MDESGTETGRGGRQQGVLRIRQVQITILQGPNQGAVYLLGSPVVRVGKTPDNDIVLPDPTVSRRHLRIVRTMRGCLVEDLGSTNGTVLDGSSIRQGYAKPGSVIKAGDVAMELRWRWIWPALGIDGLPEDFPLAASSASMRMVAEAVQFVQGLSCPVAFVGERGTGRHSLANWMLRRAGGRLRLVEIDSFRYRGVRDQLRARKDLRSAVSGADAVVLVDPWLLGTALQAELLRTIEEKVVLNDRAFVEGVSGFPFRVITILSEDPRNLSPSAWWDQRVGDYLTTAVIDIPPLRTRPRDIETGVSSLLAEGFGGSAGALDENFGLARSWIVAVLSKMTLPRNWLDVSEFVTAVLKTGLAHQGAAPLATGSPGVSLTEDSSFRDWKAAWVAKGEALFVSWILDRAHGNVSAAARSAGMDRKHLARLAKRHGILPSLGRRGRKTHRLEHSRPGGQRSQGAVGAPKEDKEA